jgi:hypothetical protein
VQVNTTTTEAIIDARTQLESMRTPGVGAVVVPPAAREREQAREAAGPASVDDERFTPAASVASVDRPSPAGAPARTAAQLPTAADTEG